MHASGEVLRSLQSALDECLVDDDLRRDVRQLTSLPAFDLLSHGLKVPLHAIHANRDAIDQRKRLRVFSEHGREHARDNVSEFCMPRVQLPRRGLLARVVENPL